MKIRDFRRSVLYAGSMQLDALTCRIKRLAQMPESALKAETKVIVALVLDQYVEQQLITADARRLLLRMLTTNGNSAQNEHSEG